MLKHVTSVKQFLNKDLLNDLFASAAELQAMPADQYPEVLKHKVLATLFFEPSTRTRFSFETAIYKLGGNVITSENGVTNSSAAKGESLEDTIRTVNNYADAIIMRHPEAGSAEAAAKVSKVPIINGGDGGNDHPTQALLDLYTILQLKGTVDGLTIVVVGDLLHSRSMHALFFLLTLYKVKLYLIAPPDLQLNKEILDYLKDHKVDLTLQETWDDIRGEVDVVYSNRIQQERFADKAEYNRLKDSYCITGDTLKDLKKDAIILNPLPRINEISPEVDNDPRAKYFEQAGNGLYVRMALLKYLFSA